jgi:acyl-CoA reductase-like NAD-dependent aldehyde dehydrogenase
MSVPETIERPGHLVDGEIVRGEETFDVINPSSGDVAAHVPTADAALLGRALDSAARAQPAWAADLEARRAAIRAMCDVIEANFAELDALAALEKYKVIIVTTMAHIDVLISWGLAGMEGASSHGCFCIFLSLDVISGRCYSAIRY